MARGTGPHMSPVQEWMDIFFLACNVKLCSLLDSRSFFGGWVGHFTLRPYLQGNWVDGSLDLFLFFCFEGGGWNYIAVSKEHPGLTLSMCFGQHTI